MLKSKQRGYDKVCNHCGNDFKTLYPHTKFCSNSCRCKNVLKCSVCKQVVKNLISVDECNSIFCSKKCIKKVTKKCKFCKESFIATHSQKYCTKRCLRQEANRTYHVKKINKPAVTRECSVCSKMFKVKHHNNVCCSVECLSEKRRIYARNRYKNAPKKTKPITFKNSDGQCIVCFNFVKFDKVNMFTRHYCSDECIDKDLCKMQLEYIELEERTC